MLAKSMRVKAALIVLVALTLGACANSSPSSGDNTNPPPQQQPPKTYMGY